MRLSKWICRPAREIPVWAAKTRAATAAMFLSVPGKKPRLLVKEKSCSPDSRKITVSAKLTDCITMLSSW